MRTNFSRYAIVTLGMSLGLLYGQKRACRDHQLVIRGLSPFLHHNYRSQLQHR